VEIFGVPEDALFAVNMSPANLEKVWHYKVTLRSPFGLEAALRLANPQPAARKVLFLDVRTGIIFYSKAEPGRRISSFYFERTGRSGAAGDSPVSFGPAFLPNLKKALHFSIE